MSSLVSKFGILRLLLMLSAVLMILGGVVAAFAPEDFDWDTMPVALGPAFAPIVFTVILFDIVMCKIRLEDVTDNAEETRFLDINRTYKILLIALLLSWTPFIWSIVKDQL